MRIIAGVAKGRHLYSPKGLRIRPTLDKVREALFNILGEVVQGSSVLDLFAGTGAMGIEALSRGAETCLFVENYGPAVETIKKNLKISGLESKARVLKMDVFKALPLLSEKGEHFEIAFLDPPYSLLEKRRERERLFHLLEDLAQQGILSTPGIVALEHRKQRIETPECLGRLLRFDERIYDDTQLTFWRLE